MSNYNFSKLVEKLWSGAIYIYSYSEEEVASGEIATLWNTNVVLGKTLLNNNRFFVTKHTIGKCI